MTIHEPRDAAYFAELEAMLVEAAPLYVDRPEELMELDITIGFARQKRAEAEAAERREG